MKRLGTWSAAAPGLWHPPSEGTGAAAFESRQNIDHEHVVVSTFGRLLIVTDNEGRFVEVAVVCFAGGSRPNCGPHLVTTKGTIE